MEELESWAVGEVHNYRTALMVSATANIGIESLFYAYKFSGMARRACVVRGGSPTNQQAAL